MLSIQVNNYSYSVKPNLSIIEACKYIGIILPRFCYHEKLTVAASCRMCVVEIERLPKPVRCLFGCLSAGAEQLRLTSPRGPARHHTTSRSPPAACHGKEAVR